MIGHYFDIQYVPLACTMTQKIHKNFKNEFLLLFVWSTVCHITLRCVISVVTPTGFEEARASFVRELVTACLHTSARSASVDWNVRPAVKTLGHNPRLTRTLPWLKSYTYTA